MAETILITITDVQAFRQVDAKFSVPRFESFCNDIQRNNLRGLLGDALYFAFMADARLLGAYAELLNGKSYLSNGNTIQYYGLKPLLCYWWLAIAARESDLFLSNVGPVQFSNNPQQNFETSREKERIATQYMETAQGYANDVIKFLNTNASTYPLWGSTKPTSEVNFLTFKV
jgi:hypothetical protein